MGAIKMKNSFEYNNNRKFILMINGIFKLTNFQIFKLR